MIKLKSLVKEEYKYKKRDIIVGTITVRGGKILASDEWLTHGYMLRDNPKLQGDRIDWRYNKPLKTLFWWTKLNEIDGKLRKMVIDYLNKHRYNVEQERSLHDLDNEPDEFKTQYYHSHGKKDEFE